MRKIALVITFLFSINSLAASTNNSAVPELTFLSGDALVGTRSMTTAEATQYTDLKVAVATLLQLKVSDQDISRALGKHGEKIVALGKVLTTDEFDNASINARMTADLRQLKLALAFDATAVGHESQTVKNYSQSIADIAKALEKAVEENTEYSYDRIKIDGKDAYWQ